MMEQPKPIEQHRFLERLVGIWDALPDEGSAETPQWTETGRSMDGLWFVVEGKADMGPDGQTRTLMTLGYDPAQQHYVGTWVGTMMTKLWVYKGWVEDDGRTLTLEAEGPAFDDPGKTALYHDAITFLDDDHRRFTGSVRQPDGTFKQFMAVDFRRRT